MANKKNKNNLTSYAHPTYAPCPDGCTETHTYIHLKKCVIKIIRVANPGPLEPRGTKSYAKIVNNDQLLTGATKTYIPGVTGRVDTLLNLTVIKNNI